MVSLANLLAVAAYDLRDGEPDEFDVLEARQYMRGLARALQDEDLVIELAKRLYESRVVAASSPSWEELDSENRNHCILKALDVVDALRDLITEELAR